jgi:hypothetical protein
MGSVWRRKLSTVLNNWDDRSFWYRVIEQYGLKNLYYRGENHDQLGIDIMSAEWDTLIILDACRYDSFIENKPSDWPSTLPVRSKAANTYNFYSHNFDGKYTDTVVVTANPRTVQLRGNSFHDIVPVFEDDWNEVHGTVLPEVMAERTIEAHNKYPKKRILSHWIQPHYPFIGGDIETHMFNEDSIWLEIQRGNVNPDDARQAYKKCLRETFPHVQRVLDEITGMIVVSSDHGNVFGERPVGWPLPVYGHPRGILMEELVTIPWMIINSGERREITTGKQHTTEANTEIKSRLKDLGYV